MPSSFTNKKNQRFLSIFSVLKVRIEALSNSRHYTQTRRHRDEAHAVSELQFSVGAHNLRTMVKNRISIQTRGCLNVTEVGRRRRRNMYDVITGTLENNSEEGWLWSCLLKQWREHVRVNVPIRGRLIPISEIHESSTPLKACQSVVWLMQRMTVSS